MKYTNKEKREAVLKWLLDEEGRLWSNSHIAKQCDVNSQTVANISKELEQDPNYIRPTIRKSINKWGQEERIKTSKIGGIAKPLKPKGNGIVYCSTNKSNNQKYVGQTINDFETRKKDHLKSKDDSPFHKDLQANPQLFVWEILEDKIHESELDTKEALWIACLDTFRNGYNQTPGHIKAAINYLTDF